MNRHEIDALAQNVFTGLYSSKSKRMTLEYELRKLYPTCDIRIKKNSIKINGDTHSIAGFYGESSFVWVFRGGDYYNFIGALDACIETFSRPTY